jgi:hypothetical protein
MANNRDPFEQPIGAIATPVAYQPYTDAEPEIFFDGDRFLTYIGENFEYFDVITYSNSRSSTPPLRRIHRLITNLPLAVDCPTKPRASRVVVNCHAKVFLCYSDKALQCAYVGSQNLAQGTQINIMYRVSYELNHLMLEFFESLWQLAFTQQNDNSNSLPSEQPSWRRRKLSPKSLED